MIDVKPATKQDMIQLGKGRYYGRGPAFVMRLDDKMIAAGGIVQDPDRPTVGIAWTFAIDHHSAFLTRRFHKWVKLLFNPVVSAMKFQRVESFTFTDSRYCKWLERLGFEFECVSKKYYLNQDWARFAWVRKD